MTILLAVTLAASMHPTCSWDHPGQNPYTGNTAAAIDRYADIPESVRGTLKRRIAEGLSDDQVNITRDGISGKGKYDPQIRDMHFGKASVCGAVTRSKWAEDRVEPGAVYCVDKHCILVPKICGNVSRISRAAPALADAAKQPLPRLTAGARNFDDMRLVDADKREEPPNLDELEQLEQQQRERRAQGGAGSGVEEVVADEGGNKLTDDYTGRPALGQGLGVTPGGGGDDGSPTAVPEADTWAMMLGGLGLVGWFSRRRARAASAADAAKSASERA